MFDYFTCVKNQKVNGLASSRGQRDAVVTQSKGNEECVLVAQSCPTLATPWTVAHQAPLSMGFSRQEYWNGLPFPSPGDFSRPRN